jgi:signal transduction histidine kinase
MYRIMERQRLREALQGYGVAVGGTVAVVGLWLLLPWRGEHISSSMFLITIGGAGLVGGFWPGMLATVLGAVASLYVPTHRPLVDPLHPGYLVTFVTFWANGPLVSLVCAMLKRTIRDLRRANAELERAGREKASRLERQLRHADRLSTVGRLAAGIAHELGTPLMVVRGRAKRIVGRARQEGGEDALIIVEQADRMAAIIRQLLDYARQRGAVKAPTDVAALARETMTLLKPFAAKRCVTLRIDAADATPAPVDAGQLQQVLANLVMNGIQAMRAGGELLVAIEPAPPGAAPQRADPSADPITTGGTVPPGAYLRVRVVDQGVGIQPEHLAHVFDPFFTTKDVGEGTGLGLSVTQGIVAEHGGWIDVASQPGVGTTFTVHLPLS